MNQRRKGEIFRDLHSAVGIFVMPNAWNAGSAVMLADGGFSALGTTSAGIAFARGLPDYESALARDAALEETRRIVEAVDLPVSADTEDGYGPEPATVFETMRLFAQAGVVGASVEDYSGAVADTLYERERAAERVRAAREAADALDFPFTLTARAECYLVGHPNPLEESIIRANLYREAGADCLFVPGVADAESITTLAREIDGPINVVMGLAGNRYSLADLATFGVRRVSIGGSLARATFGLIRRAADEMREQGTFTFADGQVPDAELCKLFASARVR